MNDPKGFWNIIEQMNNWGKEKTDETDQIKPSVWKDYFTKLLNETNETPETEFPNFAPTFHPILCTTKIFVTLKKPQSVWM